MIDCIELTLPWSPSVNHYWRNVGGKVLVSAEGRKYQRKVSDLVSVERYMRRVPLKPYTGRLAVRIEAAPPDRRRRDIDNLNKCVLDSITKAGIWLDDSQVDELTILRLPPEKDGRLRVVITTLPVQAAA